MGTPTVKSEEMQKTIIKIIVLIIVSSLVSAQMIVPSIDDPNEPFCYFSEPTDVIGIMDGREATLVSPEGYFYTGWGELMFFTGNPPLPINKRVKTLKNGYLPIIQYTFNRDGIEYNFQAFASTLDGNPENRLYNFVRVTLKNTGERRATYFSIASRYQNDANTDWGVGDNRFGRPIEAERLGAFEQLGDEFSQDALFSFSEDGFFKDNKLLYHYPTNNIHQKLMTFKTGYNEAPSITPTTLYVLPTTPVGIVQYKFILDKGEETVLEFKFPYLAKKISEEEYTELKHADYSKLRKNTEIFWNGIINEGIKIVLPEEKVNNTFKASLVYDLIAREKRGNKYIQKVNHFQYDAFWLRDASFVTRMYDVSGYHQIAREVLEFFPNWQNNDGNFVSHGGQFDGWGQVMWAYGQHFQITKDTSFAEWAYPQMKKAFTWLKNIRKTDSLGIIPVTTPGDNEDITGHVTGHNFWALAGLKNIILVAEALNKDDDIKRYKNEYEEYFEVYKKILDRITKDRNGYIPPGIDEKGGQDWGNMISLYPVKIFTNDNPMVQATIDSTRAKYQEGIMTYGDGRYLHHYLTMKNTETQLITGAQENVIEELYSILLHTGSTHSGFEFSIRPWGTRDFGMNLSPHGWFAAEFRTLIRNMLIREEGDNLHLLSAISPEWAKEGNILEVKDAPTNFGIANFEIIFSKNYADVIFKNNFTSQPKKIIVNLPWFLNVTKVSADGELVGIIENAVTLDSSVNVLKIHYNNIKELPEMNYQKYVEAYKAEYQKRYLEYSTN